MLSKAIILFTWSCIILAIPIGVTLGQDQNVTSELSNNTAQHGKRRSLLNDFGASVGAAGLALGIACVFLCKGIVRHCRNYRRPVVYRFESDNHLYEVGRGSNPVEVNEKSV